MSKEEPYILSNAERQALQDEKKDAENAVRESEQYGAGTNRSVDADYLKKKAKQLGDAIQKGSPKDIGGGEKDRLAKESKELREKIREGMPTNDEMRRPEKHPGAVHKHISWEKRNFKDIQRFKQINRQLNPDDPSSGSVETLRREEIMANNVNTNPVYLDTWAADVTVSSTIVHPKAIHITSATAGDTLVFIDNKGNVVIEVAVPAAVTTDIWFPEGWQCDGLIFDLSASTITAAVVALIYV